MVYLLEGEEGGLGGKGGVLDQLLARHSTDLQDWKITEEKENTDEVKSRRKNRNRNRN